MSCGKRIPDIGSNWHLAGDGGLGVGKPDNRAGRWPWLVLGRALLKDDAGRDDGATGLSDGKKLDLRLRGDGEGGIWERVSTVRSDKEGLGRRDSGRDLAGGSTWASSILPVTDVSTACDLVAACCVD